MLKAKTRLLIWLISFLLCFSPLISFAVVYTKTNDNTTAAITEVHSSKDILKIKLKFSNSSQSAKMFSSSFSISAWQNGQECSRGYFSDTNASKRIKETTIDVEIVFYLIDNSLVEITLDKWIAIIADPIIIYFNPKTQQTSSTKSFTTAVTQAPTQNNSTVSTGGSKQDKWTCPNCGKEISSKFCPDCGIPSPTPIPTPTPTPAPTTVPMDTNKPAENVVKQEYTYNFQGRLQNGEYTGEMVDGFPHGFGVFVAEDNWHYIGNWSFGTPTEAGYYYTDGKDTLQSYDFENLELTWCSINKTNENIRLRFTIKDKNMFSEIEAITLEFYMTADGINPNTQVYSYEVGNIQKRHGNTKQATTNGIDIKYTKPLTGVFARIAKVETISGGTIILNNSKYQLFNYD